MSVLQPAHGQRRASVHDRLKEMIDRLAHFLPAQGPMGVFIHHNTLHAFQHMPFEAAVVEASRLFGTEPYMQEEAYRAELARGRILSEDIDAVLRLKPSPVVIPGLLDRARLRKRMISPGLRHFHPHTIEWQIEETDLLKRFRPELGRIDAEATAVEALFSACLKRVQPAVRPVSRSPLRPQELILAATGVDIDKSIHPLLIRLTAVFLDQGVAYWPMPNRSCGFLESVRTLLQQSFAIYPKDLDGLAAEFRRQSEAQKDASDVILESLATLGVPEPDWEPVLRAELLALPGWAGLMRRLEEDPCLAPHERLPCSLMDFLAVRMTMTAVAASNVARPPQCAAAERVSTAPSSRRSGTPLRCRAVSRPVGIADRSARREELRKVATGDIRIRSDRATADPAFGLRAPS